MGIGRRGQRKVSQVLFGIARLLQRAQHQEGKNALFRLAGDLLRQLLIHARRDVHFFRNLDLAGALARAVVGAAVGLELHPLNGQRPYAQRITESCGDHFKVVNPLGVGLLVNPVKRSDALVFQIRGHALVGRKHEFFNQAMRDVALRAGDALHQSEFVELDHRLGQIEIDGAAALALAVQDQGQVAHPLEPGHQLAVALARAGVAFEHQVHVGVGHALGGTNHAFAQFVAENFALMIDLHDARHHQAVHLRTQAADIGRKLEWKHGHGAIGKIDAGAAQARLLIERRIRRNVVGHVGDVHLQLKVSILQMLHDHGVVEIARGLSIDGDNGQGAEVAPLLHFRTRE